MQDSEHSMFSKANDLYRQGMYHQALDIYYELANKNPQFHWYSSAYEKCRQHIKNYDLVRNEIDETVGDNVTLLTEALHPGSEKSHSDWRYVVVTPVLNGEQYLALTLESVLSQEGGFFINYVVKDGCSTDDTHSIVMHYANLIQTGRFRLRCKGIRLTFLTSRDQGMYDAIATGFSFRSYPDDAILTYINADDLLHPSAFEIVRRVFRSVSVSEWVIGQPNVINSEGENILNGGLPFAYNRQDILNGLHDGRSLQFIQQEGSFWRNSLYQRVGGCNRRFRLAGDYDLWRKFAIETEPLTVSKSLGSFRCRAGQLSSNTDSYYEEIDRLIMPTSRMSKGTAVKCSNSPPFPISELRFLSKEIENYTHSKKRRPGALCLLDVNGNVEGVAYWKRAWPTS